MNIFGTILFASLLIYANGQYADSDESEDYSIDECEIEYWKDYVDSILVESVSKFALRMARANHASLEEMVTDPRPNVVFSPLSIVNALFLIVLGSTGDTCKEVMKTLGLECSFDICSQPEIVYRRFRFLFRSAITRYDMGARIISANGIFIQNGYPIREEFRRTSEWVSPKNNVSNIDFNQRLESLKTINEWANRSTRKRISSILKRPVDTRTKVMIVSLLHFKAEWTDFFYSDVARRMTFKLLSNEVIAVNSFSNRGQFLFYKDVDLQVKIIGLPFRGRFVHMVKRQFILSNKIMMYVMLPTEEKESSLEKLQSRLTFENINALISNMKMRDCWINLPQMSFSDTFDINRALQSLGLRSLFDPKTSNLGLLSPGQRLNSTKKASTKDKNPENMEDKVESRFNGTIDKTNSSDCVMNKTFEMCINNRRCIFNDNLDALRNSPDIANPGLYVSDIFHKVQFDINNNGSQKHKSIYQPNTSRRHNNYEAFIADRPFMFFIREESTNLIILWGTIHNPLPFYSNKYIFNNFLSIYKDTK